MYFYFKRYYSRPKLKKKDVFNFVKDKVWQKLQGWHHTNLSRAEKEILLKTVAQAVPNYVMNVFLLPLDLCSEIEIMMNSYRWGGGNERTRGIKWKAWSKLCLPKNYGGTGSKKLQDFNIAMLERLAWRMVVDTSSLVCRICFWNLCEHVHLFLIFDLALVNAVNLFVQVNGILMLE